MNDNEYIGRVAVDLISKGSPLVLASIVSLEGSSPRHTGTKMVVGADGKSYGTIGGSLMEATAIKESWTVIAEGRSKFVEYALTGRDANSLGMICGGKTLILLDYIPATAENLKFFQTWQEAALSGNDFYFLTLYKENGKDIEIGGHSILTADGRLTGTGPLSESDTEGLKSELNRISIITIMPVNDKKVVVDPILRIKTAYIFGAGHVAVPTAHMASLVGFRVFVIDDRPEYASVERFPNAYNVRVIDDFNRALEGLKIDADSFIIIVTRGHQYDREVLQQALKTSAGYIGMISSRRKRDTIYNALMAEGVTQEELARVHSPIGIPIGGETPEEIAVSIVAELVQVRASQTG